MFRLFSIAWNFFPITVGKKSHNGGKKFPPLWEKSSKGVERVGKIVA